MDPYILAAARLNAWRVVPRLVLLFYCAFFARAWFYIVDWFIAYDWSGLPDDQIVGAVAVAAVAGFPAVILGILTKVFFQILELYQKTYVPPEDPT